MATVHQWEDVNYAAFDKAASEIADDFRILLTYEAFYAMVTASTLSPSLKSIALEFNKKFQTVGGYDIEKLLMLSSGRRKNNKIHPPKRNKKHQREQLEEDETRVADMERMASTVAPVPSQGC